MNLGSTTIYVRTTTQSEEGFTLVELMLYLVLAVIMLGALTSVYNVLLTARIKNETINEVEQQGQQVLQQITQAARNAQGIVSPVAGAAAGTLVFNTYSVATSPTTFTLNGGVITVCEGSGCNPVALTANNVLPAGLIFTNLSRPNTPGNVKVQFSLNSSSASTRNEYQYNKTFYGSASLRHPN